MRWLKTVIIVVILILRITFEAFAKDDVIEWTSGDYVIPDVYWTNISKLITRNDVTVTTYEGGGVGHFWMYDNSELISYYGGIAYLYLYDNVTISFYGGANPMEIYIDPASTAIVKLYAYGTNFNPSYPPGEGTLQGYWLANDNPFSIDFVGEGAISAEHIQIIPEPATLLFLGFGALAFFRNHRR